MKDYINKITEFTKKAITVVTRPKVLLAIAGVVVVGTAGFLTYDYQRTVAEEANSDQQVSSLWSKVKSAASKVKKFVVKHTPSVIKQGVKNLKTVARKIVKVVKGSSSSKSNNSSGHSSGGGGSSGGSKNSSSSSKTKSKAQQAQSTYNNKKNSANQALSAAQKAVKNAKSPLEKAIAQKLLKDATRKKLSAERYGLTAAVLQEAEYNVKVKAALNKLKKASTDSQVNLARAELNIVRSQYQGAQRNVSAAKERLQTASDNLAAKDSSYKARCYVGLGSCISRTLSSAIKAPYALSKSTCNARGLVYSANGCNQKKCADGSSPVSGKYNYCSKSVTNIISQTDCRKLGRIWLSGSGCAHQVKGSTGGTACSDGTQTYVSTGTVDYCTSGTKADLATKKAVTKTVKFVAPYVSVPYGQNFVTSNGQVISGKPGSPTQALQGFGTCGSHGGCGGFHGCVNYVNYRLTNWGVGRVVADKDIGSGQGYGREMVDIMVKQKGWKKTTTPSAGAVFSMTATSNPSVGHVGIIRAVTATRIYVEDNWTGTERIGHFDVAKGENVNSLIKRLGMTFAVPQKAI